MKLAIILAAVAASSAFAGQRVTTAPDGDFIRLHDTVCSHGGTLALIPAHMRPRFKKAMLLVDGRPTFGCWTNGRAGGAVRSGHLHRGARDMIVLDAILHSAINPALALLPVKMDSDAARVMLLAIGLQESRMSYRAQKTSDPYTKGPARGLWQFERGGGVFGVLSHRASKDLAAAICKTRGVLPDSTLVHARLEFDDVLAAAFARLLLWTDSKPLPGIDADHETAWQQYIRCWRPGKPHRHTWDAFHQQAQEQVMP